MRYGQDVWAFLGCLGWAALAATSIYLLAEIGTPDWVYGLLLIALFFVPGAFALVSWYRD